MKKALKIATYVFMPVIVVIIMIVSFSLLTYHGMKALFERD